MRLKDVVVADLATLDDVVSYHGQLRRKKEDYEAMGLTVPRWITRQMRLAEIEAESRARIEKQLELERLRSAMEADKSQDEVRQERAAKIAALEEELGI